MSGEGCLAVVCFPPACYAPSNNKLPTQSLPAGTAHSDSLAHGRHITARCLVSAPRASQGLNDHSYGRKAPTAILAAAAAGQEACVLALLTAKVRRCPAGEVQSSSCRLCGSVCIAIVYGKASSLHSFFSAPSLSPTPCPRCPRPLFHLLGQRSRHRRRRAGRGGVRQDRAGALLRDSAAAAGCGDGRGNRCQGGGRCGGGVRQPFVMILLTACDLTDWLTD
jgi:hypothetical protein